MFHQICTQLLPVSQDPEIEHLNNFLVSSQFNLLNLYTAVMQFIEDGKLVEEGYRKTEKIEKENGNEKVKQNHQF